MLGGLKKGRVGGLKKNCGTGHDARFRLVFRNVHCASLNETNKVKKEQWD
jgi:hypothetical protein